MKNEELLKQLKNELQNATPYFRRTELYTLLKTELTRLGYWKAQGRGNPKKGFTKSKAAQEQAQFKQSLKINNQTTDGYQEYD